MGIISNVQSEGRDFSAANLNMATNSIRGCTPLPRIGELTDQLKQGGFEKVKSIQLMPGSAFYGITAQ